MSNEALIRLELASVFDLLADLPRESVDCVITDPPYESLERHRAKGTTTRLVSSWFDTFPNRQFPKLLLELYRILKPQRHVWILCDRETEHILTDLAEMAGFYVWNSFVWVKTTAGTVGSASNTATPLTGSASVTSNEQISCGLA